MTAALRFDPIRLPPECEKLRKEVRAFLADEIAAGTFNPFKPNREDADAKEFSRRIGEARLDRMTWPKKYGGHERSFLERYVVTEEMRVANAPTRRFFVADRQSGPVLLKIRPRAHQVGHPAAHLPRRGLFAIGDRASRIPARTCSRRKPRPPRPTAAR